MIGAHGGHDGTSVVRLIWRARVRRHGAIACIAVRVLPARLRYRQRTWRQRRAGQANFLSVTKHFAWRRVSACFRARNHAASTERISVVRIAPGRGTRDCDCQRYSGQLRCQLLHGVPIMTPELVSKGKQLSIQLTVVEYEIHWSPTGATPPGQE